MRERENPRMMTVREIARMGVLSESALRSLLKAGKLLAIYVGNRALINYDKLCDVLQHLKADLALTPEEPSENDNE